jgi:hypothetical protein
MNCSIKLDDEIETAKQHEGLKQTLLRLLDDPQIQEKIGTFSAPFRSSSIDWHKRPAALVPLIISAIAENISLITKPVNTRSALRGHLCREAAARPSAAHSNIARLMYGVQPVPEGTASIPVTRDMPRTTSRRQWRAVPPS